MKTCPKCDIPKALVAFSKNRNSEDGLQRRCKVCAKDYRFKNKEEAAIVRGRK